MTHYRSALLALVLLFGLGVISGACPDPGTGYYMDSQDVIDMTVYAVQLNQQACCCYDNTLAMGHPVETMDEGMCCDYFMVNCETSEFTSTMLMQPKVTPGSKNLFSSSGQPIVTNSYPSVTVWRVCHCDYRLDQDCGPAVSSGPMVKDFACGGC